MITAEALKRFAPTMKCDPDKLVAAIGLAVEKAQLNTQRRLRYFLTQTQFETQGYTKFEENLNYSTPERLVTVWPTRFALDPKPGQSLARATEYVRQPQKLANFVYANRNGNGGPETNDGWNFRGQGCIHTTFRNNFLACSKSMYGDDRLVKTPQLIQEIEAGMLAAAFFWNTNGLNALADADSFTEVTRRINGSAATVPERLPVLNLANTLF
jgi:putative chitinase